MTGYQLKKKDLFSECPKHKVEGGNTPPVCLQLHQRETGGLKQMRIFSGQLGRLVHRGQQGVGRGLDNQLDD